MPSWRVWFDWWFQPFEPVPRKRRVHPILRGPSAMRSVALNAGEAASSPKDRLSVVRAAAPKAVLRKIAAVHGGIKEA